MKYTGECCDSLINPLLACMLHVLRRFGGKCLVLFGDTKGQVYRDWPRCRPDLVTLEMSEANLAESQAAANNAAVLSLRSSP